MRNTPHIPPLAGRVDELARAASAVAAADSPGCVIVGARGTGKSLLARHVMDRVEAQGGSAVFARATPTSALVPFGVFISAVPEVAEGASALEAVRTRLHSVAGNRRAVVYIDDAHHLDALSADLILALAPDPALSFLLTVSAEEPGPDAVSALWRDLGADHISLGPMAHGDVATLVGGILGDVVPNWVTTRFERISGGNPFSVRELVNAARTGGHLMNIDGRWELTGYPPTPQSLVELVSARLDRMSDPERELLALLALCEPIPVTVVEHLGLHAALTTLDDADVIRIVDPDQADEVYVASTLRPLPGRCIRIDPPGYGEVVRGRLGAGDRRRHYIQAADALEATSDDDPIRTTLWRFWAGEQCEPARLLEVAREFYRAGDHQRSGELAAAAWAQSPDFATGLMHGFALSEAGRCREAEVVLTATENLVGDERELVLVTLTRAENRSRGFGDVIGANALCRATEERIVDPHWRDEVTAHRGMGLVNAGQVDDAVELLEPLLDSRVHGDRAFVTAAWAAGAAFVHAGRADDAVALARRALPVHESLRNGDLLTEPGVHHLTEALAMIATGNLDGAAAYVEAGLELTRYALPRYAYAWVSFLAGRVALQQGRGDAATGHFLEAAPIFTESRRAMLASWCQAGAAIAAAVQGNVRAARARLVAADELAPTGGRLNEAMFAMARGWLAVVDGRDDEARRIFEEGSHAALCVGDRYGASQLLVALARCGGGETALCELERLGSQMQGDLIGRQCDVARALADPADAEAVLATADRCETYGLVLEAAELCAVAARTLESSGETDQAVQARTLGRERLARCEVARTPLIAELTLAGRLTERELDVARLVAQRLLSKEIAHDLGVSVRTVENHLQHIYRKLGVGNRTELIELVDAELG